MAGKIVDTNTPIRDPKVGDKVRTETGDEGVIISSSSHSKIANSHAFTVEYAATVPVNNLKKASYQKVFDRQRRHVPGIGTLSKRQR